MKNLWSKIAALIIPLAFSQNIKAQEPDSLNKKYFLKIEIGQYIFYENWLGKLTQFSLENETFLTKNTGLNFGLEYGSQKSEATDQNYGLIKFSFKFGLNNYFLISNNKKTSVYGSFGANYTKISENPTKIEDGAIKDGTAIGFNYGGGIESSLSPKTKIFLEVKLNESGIKGHKEKIDISGKMLSAGLKIQAR
ncbi:MAG: outer membrane beta-barrel protein [Nanoarchaeota archaeon]|nr:outer membrane beta-barrel protein [Nanoarchaeota archaeon]